MNPAVIGTRGNPPPTKSDRWRSQGILAAATAAGLGAIALTAYVLHTGAPRPGRPVESKAETALARQVAALQQEVEVLRRAQGRPPGEIGRPVNNETETVPAAQDGQEDVSKDARRNLEQIATTQNKRIADELEKIFTSEPVDAAWRLETLRTIRSALGNGLENSHVDEADCASTLCRIVFSHTTPDAQRELSGQIAGLDTFKTALFYDYDKESTPARTTLYVLREGHAFPNLRATP